MVGIVSAGMVVAQLLVGIPTRMGKKNTSRNLEYLYVHTFLHVLLHNEVGFRSSVRSVSSINYEHSGDKAK